MTAAALSLVVMVFGVPLGSQSPCHCEMSNPGNPASSSVGMSGAESSRALVVTPKALKHRTISPVAQLFIDCSREVVKPLALDQACLAFGTFVERPRNRSALLSPLPQERPELGKRGLLADRAQHRVDFFGR
jgi:hypothetical protein